MNLERLAVLRAVAQGESIHGAARAMHLTPSAISQQIAKLEREVHQELIVRDGRGVRLTNTGRMLAERAKSIIDAVNELEAEVDSFRDLVAGPVAISAFATAARGLGPVLLSRLHSRYEALDATLSEHEPTDSIPMLARGDIDIVIAQDWFNQPLAMPPGLERADLFDDTADIALHRDHALASRRSISLDAFANERWITWQPGSICHEWLLHTYRSRGVEPQIAHTASEHATQLALVAAGLGPAVIPRLGRGDVPMEVRMVRVTPALKRRLFVAWRTNAVRHSNVLAVRNVLASVIPKGSTSL